MTVLDKYKLNANYECSVLPAACGGLLTANSGTMETTSDSVTECRWDIVVPIGSTVRIEVHVLDVSLLNSRLSCAHSCKQAAWEGRCIN